MLVEELDIAIVDALGNILADLMRTPPLDHVEAGPAVLGLGPRRGAYEEIVLELALQSILLHVVGESGWHFPVEAENLNHVNIYPLSFLDPQFGPERGEGIRGKS